jgi:hypothetical protein
MKVIIFIFTILISFSSFAKNPESEIDKKSDKVKCVLDNYKLCLSHINPGVVESALGNIIKFKYRCPKANINCILKQLKVLAETDTNEIICKKAQLVSYILQNQELVAKIGNHFYADVDQFLDAMLFSVKFQDDFSAMVIN